MRSRTAMTVCALLLAGCQTPLGYDYPNYLAHVPQSIMVMPPSALYIASVGQAATQGALAQ